MGSLFKCSTAAKTEIHTHIIIQTHNQNRQKKQRKKQQQTTQHQRQNAYDTGKTSWGQLPKMETFGRYHTIDNKKNRQKCTKW